MTSTTTTRGGDDDEHPLGNDRADPLVVSRIAQRLDDCLADVDSFEIDRIGRVSKSAMHFYSRTRPSVSIHDYIVRFCRYASCGTECFVMAIVYINRYLEWFNRLSAATTLLRMHLCPFNVHRLFSTALVVAIKFHEDAYWSNSYLARIAGIDVSELNRMELALCVSIGWNFFVEPRDYTHVFESLDDDGMVMVRPTPMGTTSLDPVLANILTSQGNHHHPPPPLFDKS